METKDLRILEEVQYLFFMALVLIGDMLVDDMMIVGNAIVRALTVFIVVLSVDYPKLHQELSNAFYIYF